MKKVLFLSSIVVAAFIILAPGNANAGSVSSICDKGSFNELANKTVCNIGPGSARPGDTLILKGAGYLPSKPGASINYGSEVTFTNDDGLGKSERVTMYSLPWQSLYRVDNQGRFTAHVTVPSRLYNGRYTVTFPLNEINCRPNCQKFTASLSLLIFDGRLTPEDEKQKKRQEENQKRGQEGEKKQATQGINQDDNAKATKISITVATYITDNNITLFAPRIQRNIPGSLIPGQPFAVKVEHKSGPPFTQQHKVKMELINNSTTPAKIWNLGTFEVNSHESIGTLKEDKWYIWHSVVPYELYAELKSKNDSSRQYTLKITAIDETPFIKEDNYKDSTPVFIEIPKLFSPSTEGLNTGLLVSPKKPELAKDITIKSGPLLVKGSNFPQGAKITKIFFGQRESSNDKDSRKNVSINKTVGADRKFEANISISQEIINYLQGRGYQATQISVEVEENVESKFWPYEKRDEEFRKFEHSNEGTHRFVVDGIAKIASPAPEPTPTQKPKPTDEPKPVQDVKVTHCEDIPISSWRKPGVNCEWKEKSAVEESAKPAPAPTPAPKVEPDPKKDKPTPIDEPQKNPCAGKEGYQLSQCKYFYGITEDKKPEAKKPVADVKKPVAPTPPPKQTLTLPVEPVQEKKITTHCEDVISFWRKPGVNCEWKEKPTTEESAKPAPAPTPPPKVEPTPSVDEAKENPCAGKEGYQLSQCKYFYGITEDKKPEAKKPVADVKKSIDEKKVEPKEDEPKKEEQKIEEQKKEEPKQDQEVKYCDPTKPSFWQLGCVERPQDQSKEITYCSPDKPITFQPGCVERQ